MNEIDKLEMLVTEVSQDLPWQVAPGQGAEDAFHLANLGTIRFSVVTSGQDMPLELANQRKKDLLYLQAVAPATVRVLLTEITKLREQVNQANIDLNQARVERDQANLTAQHTSKGEAYSVGLMTELLNEAHRERDEALQRLARHEWATQDAIQDRTREQGDIGRM